MTPEGQLFEKLAVLSTFDRTTAAQTDVVNLWLISWWVPFRVLYSRNEWHAICSAVAFQYEQFSDIPCWNGKEKEKVLFHRKRLKVRRSFRNISQMSPTLKKITCWSNKKKYVHWWHTIKLCLLCSALVFCLITAQLLLIFICNFYVFHSRYLLLI